MTDETRANGGYASRDQILNFEDLSHEDLVVPEWGGMTVRIRELTGAERGAFYASVSNFSASTSGGTTVDVDPQRFQVALCAMTMVDGDGARLFDDNEVEMLGRKSARALQRIYDASSRLSALTVESMDEAVEKSEAVQTSA